MRQEDKELLIKDLSARIPYGVYIEHINSGISGKLNDIKVLHKYNNTNSVQEINAYIQFFGDEAVDATYFRPYLRPMSSMTEKEKEQYNAFFTYDGIDESCFLDYIEWLNSHHFDYRGL